MVSMAQIVLTAELFTDPVTWVLFLSVWEVTCELRHRSEGFKRESGSSWLSVQELYLTKSLFVFSMSRSGTQSEAGFKSWQTCHKHNSGRV